MKKILIIFLFCTLVLPLSPIFASEIVVNSRIQEVTIYPDSVLISRVADLKIPNPGEYQIVLSDIIPEVDENSLRVSAAGNTGIKIFGAQVKKEFLEEVPSERVKLIKEDLQKLEDERRKIDENKRVLSEEKQFLDSIRLFSNVQIPKEMITKMPAIKDLDDTFKFLDTRLKENYLQIIDLELSTRELYKKMDVLRKELAQVSGPQRKLKRMIKVDLEALKPIGSELTVSYLVRGASWQPIYDARANFDKTNVELISYAIVRQATGEDWNDVSISLSTAKPSIGGSMPYVNPWFIRPYQPPSQRVYEEKSARMMAKSELVQYEAYDAVKKDQSTLEQEELNKYARSEEKGIAVVYKLPRKASVKSDGSEHKLPVSSQTLSAKFEYSSYPRAVLAAYLGSRVRNSPELQLLAGRTNIFLDGDFVGLSSIDNIGPGEEFDLYLGSDENVKIKREQVEKKVDETLIAGIPSPNKQTVFKYKLTVENYKSKKINVKLFEAMPVSEDDRIKVKIDKVSFEPKQKDWKDRKGVWLWELELAPKEKKEIFYTYIIEHPRQMQVEGL
jgi:uncharacterized protein (TIGR02231 family)